MSRRTRKKWAKAKVAANLRRGMGRAQVVDKYGIIWTHVPGSVRVKK